jgi:hypothetical protein
MVSVQIAGLLLTVGLVGAIIVARRQVPREPSPDADMDYVPPALSDDDPRTIPITGTQNPRQKEYPER